MSQVKYVGIDISKLTLDVCVLNTTYKNSKFLKLPNDEAGFVMLVDYLAKDFSDSTFRFAFEPTGSYMVSLQRFLHDNSFDFVMVNAATVHHFNKLKGLRLKTDKHDGFVIASYASSLPDNYFCGTFDSVRHELKRFGAYLSFIVNLETQILGMRESLKHSDVGTDDLVVDIEDLLSYIKAKKKEIQAQGEQLLQLRIPIARAVRRDIRGVGFSTLFYVLPLIYDSVDKYTVKQLQSYVGLDPVLKESGTSVKGASRMSKAGSALARKNLHMAAVSGLRFNPLLRQKYDRLVSSGKHPKQAIGACSAQLFRAIVARVKHYKLHPEELEDV